MEENENISFVEKPDLIIGEEAKTFLGISAKWAKIIAIIMFISIALIIIVGIGMFSLNGIASQLASDMEGIDPEVSTSMDFSYLRYFSSFISFVYIAIGLIMLYPTLKLYQFSERTQTAIRRNDSEILKSALIVILIKALVSPHSPLTAYFAVGIQGLLGYLLFSTKKFYTFSALLLGIFTLFFSGIQKIVVLTILFGNNLWKP